MIDNRGTCSKQIIVEKIIQYFGRPWKVACDEKCSKAWGINNRPSEKISDNPDDFVWLSDDELGEAPIDPGTYEGGQAKPTNKSEIPNKWCVRECERCVRLGPDQLSHPIELKDFTGRIYNIYR